MTTKSKQNITQNHRIAVLNFLQREGLKPRADIAECMSLTKPAVTIITNNMIEKGLLYESGTIPGKKARGRRKILLAINENYKLVFGAVFERDSICTALTNVKGEALEHTIIPIGEKTYHDMLEAIVSSFKDAMAKNCISAEKMAAIGICIGDKCGSFIEGDTLNDKLNRVKKDLSHAISLPIFTQTTINGATLAQQLFDEHCHKYKNIMTIRYGKQISSAMTIDGQIYASTKSQRIGFAAMQYKEKSAVDSYQNMCEKLAQQVDKEKCVQILDDCNHMVAQDIFACHQVVFPDAIFVLGDYFESPNRLQEICFILNAQYGMKNRPTIGKVSNETIYLAPCAVAVKKGFYDIGGY